MKRGDLNMSFDYKRLVKFEHNVGQNDKKYRMIGGCVLVIASIFTAKIPLILLGMILIATAYTGWCPVYSSFGKNTCSPAESTQADTTEEKVTEEKESENDWSYYQTTAGRLGNA